VIAVGTVSRQGFEAALDAARDTGSGGNYAGLEAPLAGGLQGKIAEAWESIERALREAYMHGREYARAALDKAIDTADSLIQNAGARARDVHQALLDKIRTYLSDFVDAALNQVRKTIRVEDVELRLDAIEVSQSISLNGSIKASLTEIVALTSEGQLTVAASYKHGPMSA
jgi:F0F1-type ATP synthase membrane subunit b/b'